jgi:hypothetical protein
MVSFVGEFGYNSVEFVEGEALIGGGLLVNVGAVEHLEELIVIQVFVELFGHSFELFEVDGSVLVLVEQCEHSLEAVFGLGLSDSGADDVEEFFKVKGFVLVLETDDEFEDEGISLIKTELFEGLADFSGVDAATFILIEDLEGVLEFLVVLSGESVFPLAGTADFGGCGDGCLWGLGFRSAHKICKIYSSDEQNKN